MDKKTMVKLKFIYVILKRLEKYLIEKNDFRLLGDNFDLILFVPSDKYISDTKYSLLISAQKLNNLHQRDVIKEMLNYFKEVLKFDEYNAISRINVIHSEDNFVKNLKMVYSFREQVFEINEIPVGGVMIDYAYLVKSLVLDKLIENRTLIIEVNRENKIETINAGITRIEKNFDVVYYTDKGISEIWKSDMTDKEKKDAEILIRNSDEYLLQNHYISKIPLDNILKVI